MAVAVAVLAPASAAWATDSQAAAEPFFYGTPATTDSTTFTTEALEPQTFGVPAKPISCTAVMARTAWLTIEGTGTSITIDTAGSAVDTVLAVYTGNPATTELACNDDVSSAVQTSTVTIPTDPNTTYRVQVGVFCSDAISCATVPGGAVQVNAANTGAPANDLRAGAAALELNTATHESNATASVEAGETTTCLQDGTSRAYGKTVWFAFDVPAAGHVTIRAGGTNNRDAVIALYAGTSPTALACDDNDLTRTLQATIAVDVAPGTYLVQLGGHGTSPVATIADFPIALDFTPSPVLVPAPVALPLPGTPAVPGANPPPGGPTPAVAPTRISTTLATASRKLGSGLRLTRYGVLAVPAGATIDLRCAGTGCPFTHRTTTVAKAKSVSLLSLFKHRRLRAGTTLTLRVTAPSRIGLVKTQKVTAGRLKTTTLCLAPGAAKPSAC
jgi:hypothetical protein